MTKKYDVYALGNALVDIVTEVDEAFFATHDVEKGVMTLVDEERQHVLVNAIELKEENMQSGGSAANTVIGASQFGADCYYACKVANDDMGRFFLKDLKANGVDSNFKDAETTEGITGKCLVMTTPDADRTMNTFLGISATFGPEQLDEEAIKQSHYLYIEGYLVASPTGFEAMKQAKALAEKHGVKTSLTFSDPNMVKFFKEGMTEVIGDGVDLLFCNEDEAFTFTDTDNIRDAREALKKVAKTFVITQGKNGAMIFDGDTFIDIEPYKVDAIDSNGAGDMYAGAFLYGIMHRHSFAEAGKIASLASSKVVSKIGPRLEWHEAKDVLNHLYPED